MITLTESQVGLIVATVSGIAGLIAALAKSQAHVRELKAQREASEADLASQKGKKEFAETMSVQLLLQRQDDLTGQFSRIISELADAKVKLAAAEARGHTMEAQLADLTEHLDATSAQFAGAQDQINQLREELEANKAERDDLAATVVELTAQVAQLGSLPVRQPLPRDANGRFAKKEQS